MEHQGGAAGEARHQAEGAVGEVQHQGEGAAGEEVVGLLQLQEEVEQGQRQLYVEEEEAGEEEGGELHLLLDHWDMEGEGEVEVKVDWMFGAGGRSVTPESRTL